MNADFFRFPLGDWQCISLLDGYNDYKLEEMYANVPKEVLVKSLRQHGLPEDKVTTPFTFLVVNTGDHKVLVDMGGGGLSPEFGKLVQSMRAAGIQPGEIDIVLITHAHPDHIGGTLDAQGQPNFRNARYFIQKADWDFWFSDIHPQKIPEFFFKFAQTQLGPVKDYVELIEGNAEVIPGVRMIAAPGHTPGHAVISFQSGQDKLVYIGDVVLQPLHLENPDWVPVFDVLPNDAFSSKCAIFDMVADRGIIVLGTHFSPFPSLGKVTKLDVGWRWTPFEA
jgi:glyoxylase-like metal-dependent hydrolase (beta-lactamase superfamily II)